jgi:hypothetical protein
MYALFCTFPGVLIVYPIERLILTAVFALAYFSLYWVQINVLGEFDLLPMVSILFLPAGVKFIAMLVGRHWGVFGIALGKVLVDIYSGSVGDLSEQIPHLLVWLVAPYACMLIFLKQMDLSQTLDGLTTFNLIVLALITSLVSSLATLFYFFGNYEPGYPLLKGVWSMTMGDFSGILVVLGLVVSVRRLMTWFAHRRQTNSTTLR